MKTLCNMCKNLIHHNKDNYYECKATGEYINPNKKIEDCGLFLDIKTKDEKVKKND